MNGGWIADIGQDSEGRMLFTHYGGGVHVYDGQVMQTLTRRNFLLSDAVKSVWPEEDGSIWIGGDAGLTRYRPTRTPPAIDILQVIADRAYDGDTPISLPSTQELLTIELAATSLTNPEGFVYRHRLLGQDTTWQTTRTPRVTYRDLPRGDYTFEVQAVDLDLNRSEPVRLALQVHLPYERFTWVGALLLAVGLLGWQTTRVVVRDRRLRVSNRTLEQQNDELAVARDRADAANQAKSDFLANMSHEIRTPMNAILGFAQILGRRTDLAVDLREPVQTIQRSGEHLLRLINEVLDLSRIEAGRMELHPRDFDLNGLLDGLASMFAMRCGDKDLDWRLLKTSEGVLPVHGDEAKLSQVLINLLGNAVKFTEAGKQVWLTVRDAGDGSYRFEVGDTGRGIEAASLERIFEPFEQGSAGLSEGGTGLGLAITKRLLRLMSAELAVDSVVGRGSCFSFELELPPGRIPDETSDETRWQRVRRLAAGHTVDALIVDDVPENREILAGLLEGIGVTVRTAATPAFRPSPRASPTSC
jgi:signal transduction histidine kinase